MNLHVCPARRKEIVPAARLRDLREGYSTSGGGVGGAAGRLINHNYYRWIEEVEGCFITRRLRERLHTSSTTVLHR